MESKPVAVSAKQKKSSRSSGHDQGHRRSLKVKGHFIMLH